MSSLSSLSPAFIYGTAWKKDNTTKLVKEALIAGFRAVDTAAQPRHYREELVGQALREAYKDGVVRREDIYLQTKYTSLAGQDRNNMPYNAADSLQKQIETSVASSLRKLRPLQDSEVGSYIDCVLMHSPLPTLTQTLEAWHVLEAFVPEKILSLGISNVDLETLEQIHKTSKVKPSVVQNRFYPATGHDVELRAFCAENDIIYESFWTLTGNLKLLGCNEIATIAESTGVPAPIALYSLVMNLGIVVLNGTSSLHHMREDREGVEVVKAWARSNPSEWEAVFKSFKGRIES
ncbi:aldo-keto reductase-like protein [Mytilinidion resinicola]|uniref:Aldo-keto reductase-like protein n=1 Tax=Mytilinidion resinicola TaxID=574789 RepID=A0A6A6Y3Y8_9PEZI|nr:aldo-keto reductase-like protein [Mytilinidion resinicola]KAF2802497.1 aldo-keto reductase-like protein [Mytilinidion resinicola]